MKKKKKNRSSSDCVSKCVCACASVCSQSEWLRLRKKWISVPGRADSVVKCTGGKLRRREGVGNKARSKEKRSHTSLEIPSSLVMGKLAGDPMCCCCGCCCCWRRRCWTSDSKDRFHSVFPFCNSSSSSSALASASLAPRELVNGLPGFRTLKPLSLRSSEKVMGKMRKKRVWKSACVSDRGS